MKKIRVFFVLFCIIGLAGATFGRSGAAFAAPTERMYLSGTDKDHTVDWQFQCTSGRKSGTWTTIPVPSNWEMQGFGKYTYGFNAAPNEHGLYKYTFTPPARLHDKRTYLVFEGSMTDTDAKINGVSVGPIHQGAFYRFKYDVTNLLHYGEPNLLEVTVLKDSTDTSVNRAERLSDYWVFGGIYRPVYLESTPVQHIERIGINALASGAFDMDVYLNGLTAPGTLNAQITTLDSKPVGKAFEMSVLPIVAVSEPPATPADIPGTFKTTLHTQALSPLLWTAETPHLYQVKLRLMQNGREVHSLTQRFGFRTIEVRPGDGIYLNNQKIILKGSCRHSFWPETGRTTSPAINRADIVLMHEMNMNAVRMSHYPPDQDFLDSADEMGIYVLDELGGWQKKYDTGVGAKLAGETVIRDVNHPSILFWDNGNEGGWNTDNDHLFPEYDIQKRKVLHPWGIFSNINAGHYKNYPATVQLLNGPNIFMPTEFQHGLFDGGAGAGLNDYWNLMMSKPLSAGGFIWAFLDEGIVRLDANKPGGIAFDVAGNAAPDGILGPHREKEGSYYTIKEIWSPIVINNLDYYNRASPDKTSASFPDNFKGQISLTNRYAFTNANQCRFTWQLLDYAAPSSKQTGHKVVAQGKMAGPDIAPNAQGTLALPLPAKWQDSDALSLAAFDPNGKELYTWVWPIKKADAFRLRTVASTPGKGAVTATEDADGITLSANGTVVVISKTTGRLVSVQRDGKLFSLRNGPALASGTSTFDKITRSGDPSAYVVQADYTGDLSYARWRLYPSGWLQLEYKYSVTGPQSFMGVNFDYPEKQVTGIKWLGQGPYRVYKNRLRGVTTNIWTKAYNDTATGADTYQSPPGADAYQYPEFKGYHAGVKWAQLQTTEGPITVAAQEDNLFLRLFTPHNGAQPQQATTSYPGGDLSLLDAIPAIGNKFMKTADLGPESQPNQPAGPVTRTVYWYFGELPASKR